MIMDKDAYDDEPGSLTAIDDIALVAWEAVRGYRQSQGSHTYPTWMHASQGDREFMLRTVSGLVEDPARHAQICNNREHQLISAIVKVLTEK
jgi:hypothetical protein